MGHRPQLAAREARRTRGTRSSAPLIRERQERATEETLNAESLHRLRSLFLLLDEWDRGLPDGSRVSREECEMAVDLKSS